MFKILGLGIVVATMESNDRYAKIQLIKNSYLGDNDLNKRKSKNRTLTNKEGKQEDLAINDSNYVLAQYLPLGNTSKFSSPRLSANTKVIVVSIGKSDNYFFIDYIVDFEKREPEEFIYIFGNGVTSNPLEDAYKIVVSPRNNEIRIDTGVNGGEQCAWHVGLDTGLGYFFVEDDRKNFLRVDGASESYLTYFNSNYLSRFLENSYSKIGKDKGTIIGGNDFTYVQGNYLREIKNNKEEIVGGELIQDIKGDVSLKVGGGQQIEVGGVTMFSSNGIEITGNDNRIKLQSNSEITIVAKSINLTSKEINGSGLLRVAGLEITKDYKGDIGQIVPNPNTPNQFQMDAMKESIEFNVEIPEVQVTQENYETKDGGDNAKEGDDEEKDKQQEESKEEVDVETDCKNFKVDLEGDIDLKGNNAQIKGSGVIIDGSTGLTLQGGTGVKITDILTDIVSFLTKFAVAPAIPGKPIFDAGVPELPPILAKIGQFMGSPTPPQITIPAREEIKEAPKPPERKEEKKKGSSNKKEEKDEEGTKWILELERKMIVRDVIRGNKSLGEGKFSWMGFRVEDGVYSQLRLYKEKDKDRVDADKSLVVFRCVCVENGRGASTVEEQDYRIAPGEYDLLWSRYSHTSGWMAAKANRNKLIKDQLQKLIVKIPTKKDPDKACLGTFVVNGPGCSSSRAILFHNGSVPQHSEGCILLQGVQDFVPPTTKLTRFNNGASTVDHMYNFVRTIAKRVCNGQVGGLGSKVKNLKLVVKEEGKLPLAPGSRSDKSILTKFFEEAGPKHYEPTCRFKEIMDLAKSGNLSQQHKYRNPGSDKMDDYKKNSKAPVNIHGACNII